MSDTELLSIESINVRLPSFALDCPRVWFLQAEAVFRVRRIKSQLTKFSLVTEVLPHSVAKLVEDLLVETPSEEPYIKLKEAIIKRTGGSESRDFRELFTTVELCDRSPSQLLRHMRSLLNGRHMDDSLCNNYGPKNSPTPPNTSSPPYQRNPLWMS